MPAAAQEYHTSRSIRVIRTAPRDVTRVRIAHWDRGKPNWWHGRPEFIGYTGVRRGYHFAPGYGYHSVPATYYNKVAVVGASVPVAMRRYVVTNPDFYGLAPARAGQRWIYVNNNLALINRGGVVTRTVTRVW